MIIKYSNKIWEISTNDGKCIEIVRAELSEIAKSRDNTRITKALNNLFETFIVNVKQKSINISDDIMEVIQSFLEKTDMNKELGIFVDQKIYETFFAVSSIEYSQAIEKVLLIHDKIDSKYSSFDKRRVLAKQIEQLKFCDNKSFSESTLIKIVITLEDVKSLSKDEKVFILYQYFKCLLKNQVLYKEYKEELIDSFMEHITRFSYTESTEYDLVRKRVILNITKDYILINSDDQVRTLLFMTLTNKLYGNRFIKCEEYFDTLALLYQALFFYSFCEIETLREQHRKNIERLIELNEGTIDKINITFKGLLYQLSYPIISSLLNIAVSERREYSLFEYFPENFGAKSAVWTKCSMLEFAFSTYLLFYYYRNNQPYKMIKNWDSLGTDVKKEVIETFLSFFEDTTKHLKIDALNGLQELSAWIERKFENNVKLLEVLYDNLNIQMQSLNEEKFNKPATDVPSLEEINNMLAIQIMEYKKLFGYDPNIPITGEKEITFKYEIEESEYCYNPLNISAKICTYIGALLNSIAKKKLPMITLSFDNNGVMTLLNELQRKTFNSRNYTFVDDWGLSQDTREKPEYKDLLEIVKDIEFYQTSPFNTYMFFNKEDLKFNVVVSNYFPDILNENDCDKYSERFKVADGFYKINGALYNKGQAMEIIHKTYRIQYMSVKIRTNITKESGFVVGFDYKRDNKSDKECDE